MTLDLLRSEIWRHIGEPSDLDPETDTSYQSGSLLTWVVNEGQRQVAAWKDEKTGRIFRVRSLIGDFYYKSSIVEGTLTGDSADGTIVFPAAEVSTTEDDIYNGWCVTVGTETRLIVDYDSATLTGTLQSDWATTPVEDDSYTLFKQYELLLAPSHAWVSYHISLPVATDRGQATGNLVELLKIYDLGAGTLLEKAQKEEGFESNLTSPGSPGEWIRIGNKLWYDRPLDEEQWFKAEYYRLPTDLSSATDEPEVPEHLHWGIVLWGIMWGYSRHQEPSMKWSAKQDFVDFMNKATSQYELEFERSDDHGSLKME